MKKLFSAFDIRWIAQLFGTAVGAGILFLPITAGAGGFWTLLFMSLCVGPLVFGAHRGLARMVLASSKPGQDITAVMGEFFGENAGKFGAILYFCSIYPILLIYGVGITNTVDSFMVHQLGMESLPRYVLAFILNAILVIVMLTEEHMVLKITSMVVFPLCLILFILSLILIPHWNTSMVSDIPTLSESVHAVWLTIPVLIFAFSHAPPVSSFALSMQRHYGNDVEGKINIVMKFTCATLVIFVMFFVFSCVLSLTSENLFEAKAQNISILSYLANIYNNPIIAYFGPIIAMLAISSSFFGHYMGAEEGMAGILKLYAKNGKTMSYKKLRYILALFFFITLWITATLNPSILGLIESLVGPILAMILFVMPVYAVYTIPAMAKYKKGLLNIIVLIVGLLAVANMVVALF